MLLIFSLWLWLGNLFTNNRPTQDYSISRLRIEITDLRLPAEDNRRATVSQFREMDVGQANPCHRSL
jgi:hypothetical protein